MALNSKQKKYLRGLGHGLNPVVMVGDKGLNEAVMTEIEMALEHHELIKVRLRSDREQRRSWVDQIARETRAELVHSIGQVACYFRANPERQVIELPAQGR